MRLTQMEDIGGCRAILKGGRAEVRGVLRRIRRNWSIVSLDDYAEDPKDTGYRAIHVVVERDGYPIEVQLRTPGEHDWAEAVENAAGRTGLALKDGIGPDLLLSYFELTGWAIARSEAGETMNTGFMQVFENVRERAWTLVRDIEEARRSRLTTGDE